MPEEFDQEVISSIAGKFELRELILKPEQLLLDPDNIRFILDDSEFDRYSDLEKASDSLQERIYKKLKNEPEFKLNKLVAAIKANGWIPEGGFYVKAVPNTKNYLVLEGNRRTCAIKAILGKPVDVLPDVLRSLSNIKAQELIVLDQKYKKLIERIIVSTRNTGGVLPFSAMHTAFNAYSTYMDWLRADSGPRSRFSYDQMLAKQVANSYGYTGKKMKKLLGIYRVFNQLRGAQFSVHRDHYTLIDWAISNRTLKWDYFLYDSESTLQMEEEGLNKFNRLCITPETGENDRPPIHEPKLCAKFVKIYQIGTRTQLRKIEENSSTIERIHSAINSEEKQLGIGRDLEKILLQLTSIEPNKYADSEFEKEMVADICSTLSLMISRTDRHGQNSLHMLIAVCEGLRRVKNLELSQFAKEIISEAEILVD